MAMGLESVYSLTAYELPQADGRQPSTNVELPQWRTVPKRFSTRGESEDPALLVREVMTPIGV
jgi:hypothetical protein